MELITVARVVFALILIIFLLFITMGIYNKFLQNNKYLARFKRKKYLAISGTIIIDQHNKIIEVSRHNKRHLILVGKNSEILIETYDDQGDSSE